MIDKVKKKYNNLSIIAKASLWFMFCGIIQKGISVLTTPIFTRLLSTTQYGQFSIFNSWLQIFTIITTFRLDFAVFNKGMSKYPNDRDEYTVTMQSGMTILTFAVFCIYLIFRDHINQFTEMNTFVTCLMFLELLFMPAIRVWTLRQRYSYKYVSVVAVTLALALVNASVGVIAVYFSEEKGYARIFSYVAVEVAFGIVLYIVNLKKGKKIFTYDYIKFAVLFNIPLIPYYFSSYVLTQADRIMIQKMIGLDKVGIYNLAQSVGLLMTIITTSINSALAPWEYQKLAEKKYKDIPRKFYSIMLMVLVLLMLFMAFVPEVVKILASEEYTEAIYIIPSVAASAFFMLISDLFSNIEFYHDKNCFATYISIGIAILNVVLNYFGIKFFGYVAAGYTTLICYAIFGVGHVLYSDKLIRQTFGEAVFNKGLILIYGGIIIASAVVMTILYSNIIARYGVMILLISIIVVNRKHIMDTVKNLKK